MADSPNETVFLSSILTWRKITNEHRALGARSHRGTLVCALDQSPNVLCAVMYGPRSIDRVIGARLSVQYAKRSNLLAFYVADLVSGWRQDFSSQSVISGCWQFNVETGVDQAQLVLVNLSGEPMTIDFSLYNFEIMPAQWGG